MLWTWRQNLSREEKPEELQSTVNLMKMCFVTSLMLPAFRLWKNLKLALRKKMYRWEQRYLTVPFLFPEKRNLNWVGEAAVRSDPLTPPPKTDQEDDHAWKSTREVYENKWIIWGKNMEWKWDSTVWNGYEVGREATTIWKKITVGTYVKQD